MNNESKYRKVGEKLRYDQRRSIGNGRFGFVFYGLFEDTKPVAVKRFQRVQIIDDEEKIKREAQLLLKASDHPNILRYFCTEMNDDFMFIATELCAGTLQDLIEGTYKGPLFEDEKKMLRQVTKGLAYLHSLDIVHRDIKPTNILIFVPELGKMTVKPKMKLADFGLCKVLMQDQRDFSNTNVTNPKGTQGWMAPELYQSDRCDYKVDIFPLGCIFGYTLSISGKHPFGEDENERSTHIKQKKPMLTVQEELKKPYSKDDIAIKLIRSMVDMEPYQRPTAITVLNHPFFTQGNTTSKKFVVELGKLSLEGSELLGSSNSSISLASNATLPPESLSPDSTSSILRSAINIKPNAAIKIDRVKTNEFLKLCSSRLKFTEEEFARFTQLAKDESVDVNAKSPEKLKPLLKLCSFYQHDNLIELVRLLIERGVDVNARTPDGFTALHLICIHYQRNSLNDNENIQLLPLLQLFTNLTDVDVNEETRDGLNPLQLLCQHYKHDNLIDHLRFLIDKGTRINATFLHHPLYLAFQCYQHDNLIDLVRLLVKNDRTDYVKSDGSINLGAKLCKHYKHGNLIDLIKFLTEETISATEFLHPLCEYYKHENLLDVVKFLVEEKGVDVNSTNDKLTALHLVCLHQLDNVNIVSLVRLLTKSTDLAHINNKVLNNTSMVTRTGDNLLQILCEDYKHDNLIDVILPVIEKGADVNSKSPNYHGSTPLLSLCKNYRHDNLINLVRLLFDYGADFNVKDGRESNNALHNLFQNDYKHDNIFDVANFLLEKGVDVNATNWKGECPLGLLLCDEHADRRRNVIDLVQLLIEKGAEVNNKDGLDGWNLLFILIGNYGNDNRMIALVKHFIEAGVDVTTKKTLDGFNLLHLVCKRVQHDDLMDVVQLLIVEKGIGVNSVNIFQWNALHLLCQYQYTHKSLLQIVQLLLKEGVDVNAKTQEGYNALHILCGKYDHQEDLLLNLVLLMKESGIDLKAKTDEGFTASYILRNMNPAGNRMTKVIEFLPSDD